MVLRGQFLLILRACGPTVPACWSQISLWAKAGSVIGNNLHAWREDFVGRFRVVGRNRNGFVRARHKRLELPDDARGLRLCDRQIIGTLNNGRVSIRLKVFPEGE